MSESSDNRAGPAPAAVDFDQPFVSVVMPVRNEEATIERVIGSLLAQDYPKDRYEIIVADGISEDNTPRILRTLVAADPRVRVVLNKRRLAAAGRNRGFEAGTGDFVIFVDGHCEIDSAHWLSRWVELFNQTGAGCLCRPQPLRTSDEQDGVWGRAIAAARASRLGHSQRSYIFSRHAGFIHPESAGAGYRREVFQTIGPYDESFDAAEDVEFNWRVEQAGFKSYIHPDLTVYYHPRRSLLGLFHQMKRYGRGRFYLWRKHPATFGWETPLPALFVIGTLLGVVLAVVWPAFRPVFAWAVITVYLAGMIATIPAAEGRDRPLLPLFPLVLVTIYLGLGAGFLTAAIEHPFRQRTEPDETEAATES